MGERWCDGIGWALPAVGVYKAGGEAREAKGWECVVVFVDVKTLLLSASDRLVL